MSHTASEDQDGTAEIPRDSLTHRATLTALWPGNVDLLFGGWSKQVSGMSLIPEQFPKFILESEQAHGQLLSSRGTGAVAIPGGHPMW